MLPSSVAPAPAFVTPSLAGVNAATYNTALLQAALTKGGRVDVRGQGVAYINNTLQIGDFTELTLEGGLTIRQAPGTANSLLRTTASYATGTAVTTTWSAGRLCTVTWTGHGQVVGQSVWLQGASAPAGQTAFLGVFPIVSVTDVNNVVVHLRKTPAAACSISLTAVAANRQISVHGEGLWDYDYANNGTPLAVSTQAIVMVGVDDLYCDVKVQNAYKYCLTVSAAANYRVGLRTSTTRSDGVKVYGPAFDGEILRVRGVPGDDMISFQPKEATGFLTYPLSEGDIIGVRGGNLQQDGATSAYDTVGMLTFYAHDTYTLDEIDIVGVRGENTYRAVNVRNSGDQTAAAFGRIRVAGVDCRGIYPFYIDSSSAGATLTGDKLEIEEEQTQPNGDTSYNAYQEHIHVGGSVSLKVLRVKARLNDPTFGVSAAAYVVNMNGSAEQMIFDECSVTLTGASARFLNIGNSSTTITIDQIIFVRGAFSVGRVVDVGGAALPQFTNTPEIVFDRTRFDGTANSQLVSFYGAANLTLSGAQINNANLSVARLNGSAAYQVTLRSTGSRLLGTSTWISAPNSLATVAIQGEDVQVDITQAYVARVNGARCWNTNAAAGTLGTAGVVDCSGTGAGSWTRRGAPSLSY